MQATVTSEGVPTARRGRAVASVFAMQGVGNVLASMVTFVLLSTGMPLDAVWRVALAVGAVPGLLTWYWRLRMEESTHFARVATRTHLTRRAAASAAAVASAARRMVHPPLPIASEVLDLDFRVGGTGTGSDAAAGRSGRGSMDAGKGGERDTARLLGEAGGDVSAHASTSPVAHANGGTVGPPRGLRRADTLEVEAEGEGDSEPDSGVASPASARVPSAPSSPVRSPPAPAAPPGMQRMPTLPSTPVPASAGGGRWCCRGGPREERAPGGASTRTAVAAMCATMAEFRRALLATAGAWFIFDIVLYANGLFSATVLHLVGVGASHADSNVTALLKEQALGSTVLALIALPGYGLAIAFIDRCGRRRMQWVGFLMVAVVFTAIALALPALQANHAAFIALYGLTFLFSNWGPNATTYVIPVEAFPTRARATGHGVSAAAGKLGAVVGAAIMPALAAAGGAGGVTGGGGEASTAALRNVMWGSAAVSLVGCLWTLALVRETKGVDFEALDAAAAAGAGPGGGGSDGPASHASSSGPTLARSGDHAAGGVGDAAAAATGHAPGSSGSRAVSSGSRGKPLPLPPRAPLPQRTVTIGIDDTDDSEGEGEGEGEGALVGSRDRGRGRGRGGIGRIVVELASRQGRRVVVGDGAGAAPPAAGVVDDEGTAL
jgi:hypothetical protein